MINQREVGSDTDSFSQALTMALRQDPDGVLIGEMRDLETIRAAIDCQKGQLTFASHHRTLLYKHLIVLWRCS
jgi:twitching motility protein PilT